MVLSMDRWTGKVAVVTGASAGIGAAIAEQLVNKGLIVAGIARRPELVEQLGKKLETQKGKLHPVKADMAKVEEIRAAFEWITKNLGPISILVNNAGVAFNTSLIDGDPEMWRKTLDLNVLGLCVATKEAIASMRANDISGHVVHINAVLGHKVLNLTGMNVYPATKYAVTALTETLRQELNRIGSRIKISSVSPGLVKTDLTDQRVETINKAELDFSKCLYPEDVAEAVLYVLSTPEHVQVHELILQAVGTI